MYEGFISLNWSLCIWPCKSFQVCEFRKANCLLSEFPHSILWKMFSSFLQLMSRLHFSSWARSVDPPFFLWTFQPCLMFPVFPLFDGFAFVSPAQLWTVSELVWLYAESNTNVTLENTSRLFFLFFYWLNWRIIKVEAAPIWIPVYISVAFCQF